MDWILFLCTGNYYRSRFAEEYLNHRARCLGLRLRAESRGLHPRIDGLGNPGSISRAALQELARRGIAPNNPGRAPMPLEPEASVADYTQIIALYEPEHRLLIAHRFPALVNVVVYWDIPDLNEQEPVMAMARLADRIDALLRGRTCSCGQCAR